MEEIVTQLNNSLLPLAPQISSITPVTTNVIEDTADYSGSLKWGKLVGNIKDQEDLIKYLDQIKSDLEEDIDIKTSVIFRYKGQVTTESALPTGAEPGDVYNVEDTGANYVWNGEEWDKLSETIDLRPFLTIEKFNTEIANYITNDSANELVDNTKQEIDTHIQQVQQSIPTRVSQLENDANYITEHQDISNLVTTEQLEEKVKDAVNYQHFEYGDAQRKTIQLANYDSISGIGTDGIGYNLAMVSKWDKADFGAAGITMNLNTKDVVTINDDKVVATTEDIQNAIAEIPEVDLSEYAKLTDIENMVEYKEFTYESQTRKTIELANYDSISGLDTKGTAHNLAMVSKWDVADFGAPSLHINLNTKDNVTINDDQVVATIKDLEDAISTVDHSTYATKEELNSKANAEDVYTKTECDDKFAEQTVLTESLEQKADKIDTYNKSEVDAIKQELQDTNTQLDSKIDTTKQEIESKLQNIYTKEEVDSKISSVYVYKGSVDTEASLPQQDNKIGDTYNVTDTGYNFTWDGTKWDNLGGTIDLSSYITSEQAEQIYATKAELEDKADVSDIPTQLPNPNALTLNFNGEQIFNYNGSSEVTEDLIVNAEVLSMSEIDETTIAQKITQLEDKIPEEPVFVNIPIRSLKDQVYDKSEIFRWFNVDDEIGLKRIIHSNIPVYLKYGISLSTNPHYYKLPIEYFAFESATQVKLVFEGLNTRDDKVSKYEIVINLDGTVIDGNSNVKMTITSIEPEQIDLSSYATKVELENKANTIHNHVISDITDLDSTLSGKADSIHTHDIDNITGLQDALDGKQAIGDYALKSEIPSLDNYVTEDSKKLPVNVYIPQIESQPETISQSEILNWFGCNSLEELKQLIEAQPLMYITSNKPVTGTSMTHYSIPVNCIKLENDNTITIVGTSVDSTDMTSAKIEIKANLDGSAVALEVSKNYSITTTRLVSEEALQELAARVEALESV